jgi:hypothetical protein
MKTYIKHGSFHWGRYETEGKITQFIHSLDLTWAQIAVICGGCLFLWLIK